MRGTFVVRWDGLDPCLSSDDLRTWPRDYRLGLAYGLWFDPDDRVTLTVRSLQDALKVLEPVPDSADELNDWVRRITSTLAPGALSNDWSEAYVAELFIRNRIALRPDEERSALLALADHIEPEAPF